MSRSLKPWIAVFLPYDPTYRLCAVSEVVVQKSVFSRRVIALYRVEIVPPSCTRMFEQKALNQSASPNSQPPGGRADLLTHRSGAPSRAAIQAAWRARSFTQA